jgi:hypothetical protein
LFAIAKPSLWWALATKPEGFSRRLPSRKGWYSSILYNYCIFKP